MTQHLPAYLGWNSQEDREAAWPATLPPEITSDPETWPAELEEVLASMAGGMSLTSSILLYCGWPLLKRPPIPMQRKAGRFKLALRRWGRQVPEIAAAIEMAEEINAETHLDDVVRIADRAHLCPDGVPQATLIVNTRFRVAEMRNKQRYKPKEAVTNVINNTVGPTFTFIGVGAPEPTPIIDVTPRVDQD